MTNQVISDRLKKARKDRGITQKQLAQKLGVALSVIAGAETKRGVSKQLAIKLGGFFGTNSDYWLNPNAEKEFIQTSNSLETLEEVLNRLIDEGLIKNANDIGKDKEISNLINQALKFEVTLLLRKKSKD